MNLVSIGMQQLFKGLRTSQPALSFGGFALLLIGWARSRSTSGERTLLWSKTLEPGEEVTFRRSDG